MSHYNHRAQLLISARFKLNMSQSQFAHFIWGRKSAQFISNMERALCCVPKEVWKKLVETDVLEARDVRAAILDDCNEEISGWL